MQAPRAILFDHIPKCAGTSLADHLFAHCDGRPVLRLDGRSQDEAARAFAALPEATRHGYALIAGHGAFRLAPFTAPDTLRITVLRDPVERIASLHRYILQTPAHYLHAEVTRDLPRLADFAATHPTLEVRDFVTWHYTGLPPAEIARDPDEAARRAFDLLRAEFDLVGFTEDMDPFVARLDERAGFANTRRHARHDGRTRERSLLARLRVLLGMRASSDAHGHARGLARANASRPRGDDRAIPPDARAAIEARNPADLALHALLLAPEHARAEAPGTTAAPRAEIVRPRATRK
ncbi:MAG: hypothetical protein RI967_875 [Planctomycetota bacterium]